MLGRLNNEPCISTANVYDDLNKLCKECARDGVYIQELKEAQLQAGVWGETQ